MKINTTYQYISDIKTSNVNGSHLILSNDALEFIFMLESKFGSVRKKLLRKRGQKQIYIDNGYLPNFSASTLTPS